MILGTLLLALVLGAALLFVRRPLWAGAVSWLLVSIAITGGFGNLGSSWLWVALMWLIPMALFGPTPLRSAFVTPLVFKLVAPILPRIGASITFYGLAVVRQFEQMGVFSVNSALGIQRSRDKLLAMQILSRHDIGLPLTAFVRRREDMLPAIEQLGLAVDPHLGLL